MAIPKIIHFCWFGRGPKNELAQKCIQSWKKYCPDYILKEWNEDNFNLDTNEYVRQAYDNKKFAFVTDFVRLYALYNEGGIYMDTDVEVLKPLDAFLKHSAFSSFENNNKIPTGLMAAEKGNDWIFDLMQEYTDLEFIDKNGRMDLTTNVERITNLTVEKYGLLPKSSYQELGGGIVTMYPYDYFCPKDCETGEINITENTHTIHHFSGSWHTEKEKRMSEKNRLLREKYIKKYGAEKTEKIFERRNNILLAVYYFKHPILAINKITEKVNKGVKK